jgi:hypothetical protein
MKLQYDTNLAHGTITKSEENLIMPTRQQGVARDNKSEDNLIMPTKQQGVARDNK